MSEPKSEITVFCPSCGAAFTGRYCHSCGEKRLVRKELAIKHFLGQLLNAVTFADRKFLSTLKLLFTKPGFLPRAFVDGRRRAYSSPLALFFLGNLVYFLFQPADTFNSTFKLQTELHPLSSMYMGMAETKMAESGHSLEELAIAYDRKSSEIAKLLIIVIVFLFSLPVSLFFWGKKRLYFEHLHFSLSVITFQLYCFFLLIPGLVILVFRPAISQFGVDITDMVNGTGFRLAVALGLISYVSLAARRFYQQHWGWCLLKGVLLTQAMSYVLLAYSALLFYITLFAI